MSTPNIKVGQGNWGIKAGNLLGYANTEKKFTPVEFTSSRASNTATRVNASGNIEIVNANIPRIDYFGGQASLLVEPSAVNLVPSGTTYTALAGALASAVADSPAVAISGTLCTKNEASGTLRYIRQTVSASALISATTYTLSRFFKYNGVNFTTTLEAEGSTQWGGVAFKQSIVLSAASGVTLGASTACTGSVENFGNGWYRVNVRITTGATIGGSANVTILSELPSALSTGQGFLTACPQLETGSVATSYIPTTTTGVTRDADVVSVSGVAGLIGQTVGTIYCEFAYFGTPTSRSGPIYLRQAGLKGLSINFSPSDSPAGIRFISRNDANETALTIVSGALQIGTYYKIAIAYDAGGTAAGGLQANGVVAYVNGVQTAIGGFRVPDAAGLTEFRMYGSNAGSDVEAFNGRIRAAYIYPTRLPNTTTDGSPSLQSITTL